MTVSPRRRIDHCRSPRLLTWTLLLTQGFYTVVSTTPGRPSGRFSVPAQGPITVSTQPSWLAPLTGSSVGACLEAPIAKCIGNVPTPVDFGFCSVAADATNRRATT